MRVAFGLGSNLGDRRQLLTTAVERLRSAGVHQITMSPIYETDPVGGPEQPAYLNAVAVADSDLPPSDLLALAHHVEQVGGRVRTVRNAARTLDVDLLAVGPLRINEPGLRLPHPRAVTRAFVMVPWADVDPDFVIPGHGRVADVASLLGHAGVWPWGGDRND